MKSRLPLLALLVMPIGSAWAQDPAEPADAPPETAPADADPVTPPDAEPVDAPLETSPADAVPVTAPDAAPAPPSSLTLPAGALNLTLTLELEMSSGRVGEPTSLAPDVFYGATDDWTLALVHSRVAVTGFRASAGGGLCLSGDDAGCAEVYNNVGAEAWYPLLRGGLAIAAVGGLHALDFDRSFYAAKVGGKARYTTGPLGIIALPSLLVAVNNRTDATGARLNQDTLYVPVQLTYQVMRPLVLGLGSGIKGPISGFDETWQVPLGVTATYAIDRKFGVGASWVFGQLFGGATNPPDPAPAVVGPELRGVQLWASYTL